MTVKVRGQLGDMQAIAGGCLEPRVDSTGESVRCVSVITEDNNNDT